MKTLSTLAALAAAAALMCACSRQAPAPGPKPPTDVGVVTLKTEPVTLTTELAGRTTASLSADVRPQVAGIIQKRLFVEGSLVKAGQPLYQIDPATYRAAYEQAKATLQNAQAAVGSARLKNQRYAELSTMDGVAKQDADDARTAYEQALATVALDKAALDSARINLDYTTLRAPISGRIGTSAVTPGALVTASQTDALATIRALDPIYVDVTQSSAALLRLKTLRAAEGIAPGSAVVGLTLEDGATYTHKGTLEFSEIAVDQATGSVTLRAKFPNPDGTLLPGMYVRAKLDEAVQTRGILAPQQGITRDPKGNATALVVGADDKVAQRAVTTRRAIGDRWLVASGLADGDRLIVQGTAKVKAGDSVHPTEVSLASAAAAASAPAAASTASGAN